MVTVDNLIDYTSLEDVATNYSVKLFRYIRCYFILQALDTFCYYCKGPLFSLGVSKFPKQTQQSFHRICFNGTYGCDRRHPTSSHDPLQFQISPAAFDLVARASSYGRASLPRPQTKKGFFFAQHTRIYNFLFFIFNILPIQQFFSYGRVRSSGD